MRIKAKCTFGIAGAKHETEFEMPDDATTTEIDDEVWEWAINYISTDWSIADA